MGQKVQPVGMRLSIINGWESKWFARSDKYVERLTNDLKIRAHLNKRLANAGISRIVIERPAGSANVTLHTSRPGLVIGKRGADVERLRHELTALNNNVPVDLAIEEVRKPELSARLVAEGVCNQLEKRIAFRRAMRRAVQNSMRAGALGVKVMVAGRLNGAEIARTEWHREGRVPLHTLRADIDYALAEAKTTYGVIGVKVWIFRKEIFDRDEVQQRLFGEKKSETTPGRKKTTTANESVENVTAEKN